MNIDIVTEALEERYEAYENGEWFTLAFFPKKDTAGPKEFEHYQVGDLASAIASILKHPETNTYSTMGVFGKEPRSGAKGTAAEVTRCAWLWCDIDCHDDRPTESILARLTDFKPKPTIIYYTGNGYHAYWAIRPTCIDMQAIRERNIWIANRLKDAAEYKVDGVANVDRIMRVPGTLNLNVYV